MKIKAADPLKSSGGSSSDLSSFPSRSQTKGCIPRKLATFQMSIFSRSRAIERISCSGRSVRKLREIRSKETRKAWVGLQIVARPKPPPFFSLLHCYSAVYCIASFNKLDASNRP